jgi:hypothetical protein
VTTKLALNRILLWVLMDTERRGASATISVVSGKARRAMLVEKGELFSAESNLKAERIGDMLVAEGLLDPLLLEPVAAEAARRKTLLGEQLIADGLMTREDFRSALDRQVTFRLGAALSMRGQVTIEPAPEARTTLRIPMTVAVTTAFRSWVPLAAIETDLMASEEDDEEPMVLDDTSPKFAMIELGPAELRLAKKLTKGERLEDLIQSGAPREPVLRLVGALRAVGLWR